MKIGLIYGSDTGNTEYVAEILQKEWGETLVTVHNIFKADVSVFEQYDVLILGIPTWYDGEMQSDWEDKLDQLDNVDFSDRMVAIYGLGDQQDWGEYFVDAMGTLAEKMIALGARLIGRWPTDGYDFKESQAVGEDGNFYGLALDEDRQSELTEQRIRTWTKQLKAELASAGLDDWDESRPLQTAV